MSYKHTTDTEINIDIFHAVIATVIVLGSKYINSGLILVATQYLIKMFKDTETPTNKL